MTSQSVLTRQTYTNPSTLEPAADGSPVSQFQDVAISPATLASGELRRRFDPDLFPRLGVAYRDNLIPNPTFQDTNGDGIADGISNYASPTMSLTRLANGYAQHMDAVGGADAHWVSVNVQPDVTYTFSVYYRITRLAGGGNAVIKYELHDNSDALVGSDYDYHVDSALTATPYFQRFQITVTIPHTGVAKLLPIVGMTDGAIDFAYPQLEIGSAATPSPYGSPSPVVF